MERGLVSTTDLAKFFGTRLVFRSVELSIRTGELLLLAGDNGSGKSTLLKILAGLLEPTHGRVIRALEPGETALMGHETFIYPQLSAWENLRFWNRLHGSPREKAELESLLSRVGLADVMQEKAAHFSRGMAQRLSLARVLALRPRLLLLDEPATGLDKASQRILREEVQRVRTEGSAVVWVSHSPERDRDIADGVFVLSRRTGFLQDPFEIGERLENPCSAAR
jgi:heme exporter protein A